MRKLQLRFMLFLSAFLLASAMGTIAQAATLVAPGLAPFGEIERITLDDPANVYSGGVIVAGGVEMILPKNLLIDLPANRLSLQQIFDQAPAACKALGESGLAKADKCNQTGSGGIAYISAVRTNAGNVIVGDIFIQKAGETVVGVVTYINYAEGYYRVNGLPNDPATGVMVRLNDPTSRHTIQNGAGCAGGLNCSPDPRFALDADNYTNTFATGYPVCIPSTVARSFTNIIGGQSASQAAADGSNDYLCPLTNRTPGVINENPVADSRRFAPVIIGDSITAEGNYETINGVRFLSAHTTNVQKALGTRNVAGQPDYLFLEEVGIEAPAFQNQRTVAMFIGFTTLAPTDVDIWSIHRDPLFNDIHEFPLASVQGCDIAQGGPGNCSNQGLVNAGANIFKIIYRNDFIKGPDSKLSPCAHLLASPRFKTLPGLCSGGVTAANDFATMSPSPHEIIARTGHKIDSPAGSLITIDINGNEATNGEYLFPLGLNLGGLGTAEMSEIDLNALSTPITFEGIPWNLDRRLGPSGCLNGTCEAGALGGSFALDPFPYSGLDPRAQASLLPSSAYNSAVFTASNLTNVRSRIFSYVSGTNFNGNATLIPYGLGTFPADPPLRTINPTPALNIFAPITVNDAVSTNKNVAITIPVLANDIPLLGSILTSSVAITTNPVSGNAAINADGTITFTPAANFSGTVSFAYTVQNNFFAVSAPATVTVSVTSLSPATAITVTPSLASPQVAGTTITFTGAAVGGDTGPYEYRFWYRSAATPTYTLGRAYATSASWNWDTTALALPVGSYIVAVEVRHVGSIAANEARKAVSYNLNSASPATSITVTPSHASPQVAGTAIAFTGAVVGGDAGPYEYRFWYRSAASPTYTLGRDYVASASWNWDTTALALPAGGYIVAVEVRHVGSIAVREARLAVNYQLTSPATSITVTRSLASPQVAGTAITFTGAVVGGDAGPYEYRFWYRSAAATTYTLGRAYAASASWNWDTAALALPAGSYFVAVEVRHVGSIAANEARLAVSYTLAP